LRTRPGGRSRAIPRSRTPSVVSPSIGARTRNAAGSRRRRFFLCASIRLVLSTFLRPGGFGSAAASVTPPTSILPRFVSLTPLNVLLTRIVGGLLRARRRARRSARRPGGGLGGVPIGCCAFVSTPSAPTFSALLARSSVRPAAGAAAGASPPRKPSPRPAFLLISLVLVVHMRSNPLPAPIFRMGLRIAVSTPSRAS